MKKIIIALVLLLLCGCTMVVEDGIGGCYSEYYGTECYGNHCRSTYYDYCRNTYYYEEYHR